MPEKSIFTLGLGVHIVDNHFLWFLRVMNYNSENCDILTRNSPKGFAENKFLSEVLKTR